MTQTCTNSEDQREQLLEDMKQQMQRIEENMKPTKRWWHYLGIKPVKPKFMFEIEGRPTFTEQQLAERRAFLDGYCAGRQDGDAGPAYKLWRKMRDYEE